MPVSQENRLIEPDNPPTKLILQHSGIYLATRLLGAGLQLALLVYLTRQLDPGSYGALALFTAAFSFFAVLLFNPWRQTITRFWPSKTEDKSRFQNHFIVGVLLSCLLLLAGLPLLAISGLLPELFPLALVAAVIAGSWTEINLEIYRRTLEPVKYLRLFLARSLGQLVLIGAGAAITGAAWGAIGGLVTSHVLAASLTPWIKWHSAFSTTANMGRSFLSAALPDLKKWLVFAVPLALTEFVALAMVYTDRLMIATTLGLEQTGLYSAVHDLTWMGLHMVSLVAFLAFFPLVLKADDEGDMAGRSRALTHGFTLLFGLSLASTIGLSLLAEPVSQLILGEKFRSPPPRLMMIIAVVHLVYVLKVYWIDLGFSLAKRTWPLLIIGAASVLANIVLNLVLVPEFGIEGAAMATGFATLGGIVLSGGAARVMGLANYPVNWLDVVKIIAAAAIMTLTISVLPEANTLVWLAIRVIVGGGAFVAAIWLFRLSLISGIFPWKKTPV